MPLVTIIALCYNHAPFLRQALDSILAQDYPHLEVWLVDDASHDGSPEILREYAQANPAWHLLLLPQNVGNCRAFNQAFFQSKGEFVIDFATDDVLLPHRISQQVALFDKLGPSYGVVYSNAELIDEQGQPQGLHHRPDGRGGLLPRPASGWVLADVLGRYFICSPTMLMRRETLARLGGYDETLTFEDFDFWVRASPDWQFYYQNAVTTLRRLHPRSMSTRAYQPNDPYLLSTIAVCRKAVALVRSPAERAGLGIRLRWELLQALRRRRWSAARDLADLLHVAGRRHLLDYVYGLLARV
ncbi:MAG TPA: glycosyltransferase [Hymenobacter sp.]|uniref:glycosyltransferase n=1 Tax=Hymenobacter sp. TaxID=1898978 RepID=UPI002D7EE2AA|nr:glycosyltransferase [Hymenobacter sp.]HET9504063.1 glycosyltransferase [Hymenobacter sp.]